MAKDIIGILSLKDKLQRLLSEPTLDKAFSVFSSTMLCTGLIAFFTTYSNPSNIEFVRADPTLGRMLAVNIVILISFLLAILAGLASLYYNYKHEPILKQSDERRKSNKEWDYLFGHKHLKKVDITLDKVDEWRKEMDWLRNAVVSLIKYQVEKNSLTNNERETIENPDAIPALPDFPDLSDEIANATSPIITTDGEMVITPLKKKEEKSIIQELNDLEELENLEL